MCKSWNNEIQGCQISGGKTCFGWMYEDAKLDIGLIATDTNLMGKKGFEIQQKTERYVFRIYML